ncbi:bone morphogenetic protein receptor type-2-like isoform 1-T3 [Spinachia spinachia]
MLACVSVRRRRGSTQRGGSNMAAMGGALLTVHLSFLLLPAVPGLQSEDRQCAYTDKLQGQEPLTGLTNELRGAVQENGTVRCILGSRCYGLWEKRADGEMHLVKQGCWTHIGNQQACHGDRCLITAMPSQIQNVSYRFCCCSRDLCNSNFTKALPTANTPALRLLKADGQIDRQTDREPLRQEETMLIALVIVAIAAVVIVALLLGYHTIKGKQKLGLSALDLMEAANTEGSVDLDHLQLLELIGQGRFGTVFRSSLNERCIAVKLFSSAHRHNFCNERSVHGLPLLQHPHLAGFLGAEERVAADGRPEFLILMEFYPQGCLSGYLSHHTVDWSTCCRMTHGVTRGLAFLHTELYKGDQYKPAVAHRDVTSSNVLVRSDLSCVLADFGLSMQLTGSRPCRYGNEDTVAISEVGTVRYMAPEVLGGSLNLRDCESALKQVDVYALGLLYWESFRRCSYLFPGELVPEYQLAFQEELGNHPTFEEMQILVGREKFRPRFPEAWKENSLALRSLKETMEDCWDQDADARLTAQCAEERLCDLTLVTTHSAVHKHRNLSHGRWPSSVGSASTYIEDRQVGVVKNVPGNGNKAPVVKTTMSAAESCEKNSINQERQPAQTRSSTSDIYVLSVTTLTPAPKTFFESGVLEEVVPGSKVPVRLSDLEAVKLKAKEVQKNLREGSDEILTEHLQKQFGPTEPQVNSVLDLQGEQGVIGWVNSLPSSSQPLCKQQNLHHRPTNLQLLPRTRDASSQPNLGKSYHRQVETGVAKMNTVMVAMPVAPIQITTVTNNISARGALDTGGRVYSKVNQTANSYSTGIPTLVTRGTAGPGQNNPAGPRLEEDRIIGGNNINLLYPSLDEHEPLLKREHPLANSKLSLPHCHHHSPTGYVGSDQGSNSNNNNNSAAPGSNVIIQGLKVTHEKMIGSEFCQGPEPELRPASQEMRESPVSVDIYPTAQDVQRACFAEPAQNPGLSRNREAHLVRSIAGALVSSDPETPDGLWTQMGKARAQRRERPCSLDLSCISSDDGSLKSTGEKIKRRVKTPYTVKKCRPASWFVSTDTALGPDFELYHLPSSPHRAGSIPKINQSRTSMAVFLVGGGGTSATASKATTTSEPDGMTSF